MCYAIGHNTQSYGGKTLRGEAKGDKGQYQNLAIS